MTYDTYISYGRADRELAAALVRRLETLGVSAWYDAGVDGTGDWGAAAAALGDSQLLAILFSEECSASRRLRKEVALADRLGLPVAPVLIEDTQPRGASMLDLADRNWIKAWPEPLERMDALAQHLAVLVGKTSGLDTDGNADATDSLSGAPRVAAAYVGRLKPDNPLRKLGSIPPLGLVYRIVDGPRALRSFRSNIRTL